MLNSFRETAETCSQVSAQRAARTENTTPNHALGCILHVIVQFVVRVDPVQSTVDPGIEVVVDYFAQPKKCHRAHRMLMHGIHRISVGDAATWRIIVPPPLSCRSLLFAETTRTLQRALRRILVMICLEELGQAINGIDLIGEG